MTAYELGILAAQRANVPGHLKQADAQGFNRAFGKRAKEATNTVPLMRPVSDPRLKHLLGPSVTRRQAWNTAVGPQRANAIIDSAANYRAAHPRLFKDVFDGSNIDRPIPTSIQSEKGFIDKYRSLLGQSSTEAIRLGRLEQQLYTTPSLTPNDAGGWSYVPASIAAKKEAPFRGLMHELFHLDTVDTRPQDWDAALTAYQKGDWQPLQRLRSDLSYSLPATSAGQNVQSVTDRTYPTKGLFQRREIGTQLGTLRAHLEQQGIDTTNTNKLRSAIGNLKQHIGDNDEVQRFHDVIHAPNLTPEQKHSIIDDIIQLLPGIAHRPRGAQQGAPTYSASLLS
jgi:hypothetical protein